MGMKRVYNCDICREKQEPTDLLGVCFKDLKNFTLGGYGSTKGVHICFSCAKQLKTHLNNDEIEKIINK